MKLTSIYIVLILASALAIIGNGAEIAPALQITSLIQVNTLLTRVSAESAAAFDTLAVVLRALNKVMEEFSANATEVTATSITENMRAVTGNLGTLNQLKLSLSGGLADAKMILTELLGTTASADKMITDLVKLLTRAEAESVAAFDTLTVSLEALDNLMGELIASGSLAGISVHMSAIIAILERVNAVMSTQLSMLDELIRRVASLTVR